MTRTLARTAIAAAMMASLAALTAGAAPARALAGPSIPPDTEFVTTYYSSAQHTTEVGQVTWGSCGDSSWGTTSSYPVGYSYSCTPR